MPILWTLSIFCILQIALCLQCSYNIKCSSACLQRYCEYDPNTNAYNFTKCCKGCLDEYYLIQQTQQCIQDTCSKTIFGVQTYWWFRNNTCVESCPAQYYFEGYPQMNPWVASNLTGRCGKVCPEGYYSYGIGNGSKTCRIDCPEGFRKQIINGSRFCINSCSSLSSYSAMFYFKVDTNQCTDCMNISGYYKYYPNLTCTKACPQNYTKYNQVNGDNFCSFDNGYHLCYYPYVFDTQTNSCVFCQHYNSLYTLSSIAGTALCDRYCPVNYFLYPKVNKCYANCNYISDGSLYYRDYLQQTCVQVGECSFRDKDNLQTFGDNITGNCDDQCSVNSYGHPDLKICVADCFGNYTVKNPLTNMCEKNQIIQPSDAITVTKSMVIIVAVIGVIVVCIIAIIVVLLGYGIKKWCCKKSRQFQHIVTQTPRYQHQKEMNSLGSSQFLQQIQIDTENSPQKKKPRRRPSFI